MPGKRNICFYIVLYFEGMQGVPPQPFAALVLQNDPAPVQHQGIPG